jgi:hypothetical protein
VVGHAVRALDAAGPRISRGRCSSQTVAGKDAVVGLSACRRTGSAVRAGPAAAAAGFNGRGGLGRQFGDVGGDATRLVTGEQLGRRPATVVYDSLPHRFLFDLRQAAGESPFAPWPLARISKLVEGIRDEATKKLKGALPDKATTIERVFIGRDAKDVDKAARIQIVPLPSIGSVRVARSIRRVLVEVLPNCPLPADDVAWRSPASTSLIPIPGRSKATSC